MVTHLPTIQIIHTEKCERVFPLRVPLQSPLYPLQGTPRHPQGTPKAPPRHPQRHPQAAPPAPHRDTPTPSHGPPRHPRGTECLLRACEDPCWLFFHTLPHPSTPFHTLRAPFQTPHKAPHHKPPTRATTRDREGQHTRTAQGTCKAPQGPTRAPQGTYIGLGAGHTGNATYIGDP